MQLERRTLLLLLLFSLCIYISSIPSVKSSERESILVICKRLENKDISPEIFIKLIYNITVGNPPGNESLTYWLDLWRNDPEGEIANNNFSGVSCPIVGMDKWDSTRARTFALLIIRSQLSLSAEMRRPSDVPEDTILGLCKAVEGGGSVEKLIKGLFLIVRGVPPNKRVLSWWLRFWEQDPNMELETNFFLGTTCPIVGVSGGDSTRARTFALLIIRSQLSLSAEMRRPSGVFNPYIYSINLMYGSLFLIALLLFLRYFSERYSSTRLRSPYSFPRALFQPGLVITIIIGAMIRLFLAPLTEQRWDMYNWRLYSVIAYIYKKNPLWLRQEGFYSWGYPPLWLLICIIIYSIYSFLWQNQYPEKVSDLWGGWNYVSEEHISRNINIFDSYRYFIPYNLPYLDIMFKIPIIIADIMIGVMLYRMIREEINEDKGKKAMLLWIYNPLVIFISSIWGMFDSITTLFVMLSLYYLKKGKFTLSTILLGVSVCYKLYPVVLFPLYILIVYKLKRDKIFSIKQLIIFILYVSTVMFLANLFFSYIHSPTNALELSITLLRNLLFKRASPDWRGRNIINGLTPLVLLNPFLQNFNIKMNIPISPLLIMFFISYILYILYKDEKLNWVKILSYLCFAHYIIYVSYSTIHVPYYIWILPFLILLYVYEENREIFISYISFTVIGLIGISVMRYPNYNLAYYISPYFLLYEWEMNLIFKSIFTPTSLEWIILFTLNYAFGMKVLLNKLRRTNYEEG